MARHLGFALLLTVFGLTAALLGPRQSATAAPITLTLTITRVVEIDCDDNDVLDVADSCGNDYYADFWLNGAHAFTTPRDDDETDFVPSGWQFTFITNTLEAPEIDIQLSDHDSTSGDDVIDIAPGDDILRLKVAPSTLTMRNRGGAEPINLGYSEGSGEDSAKIFFTLSVNGGDIDSDGIPDGYENGAPILNLDGTNSGVNLLALGASPCRPTIAVEFDYMATGPGHTHQPLAGALTEVVNMFNNASWPPAFAGCPYAGAATNSGVNFIFRVDQSLPEVDKIDFNSNSAGAGPTVESIRDANFNQALRPWFHYSLFIHNQPDNPDDTNKPNDADTNPDVNSSSGLCCGNQGKDFIVSLGQWTNNVGSVREQSGTIVHELGHALGLAHGGADANNCKPNYLSAMSYVFQGGVPDATQTAVNDIDGDGKVDTRDRSRLDYSRQDLPDLVETGLDETQGIGIAAVTVWDTDGSSPFKLSTGTLGINWNSNTNATETNIPADITNMGVSGSQGCPTPTPGQTLTGFDDWQNLKFRAALSANAGITIHSDDHERMTFERYQYIVDGIHDGLSTTDLGLTVSDSPDPAAAGGQYTYTLAVTNHGGQIAEDLELTQNLPADVSFVSATAGCSEASHLVTCTLGDLGVGASWTVTVTVSVPADLVFNNGGPKTLSSTTSVKHDGADSSSGNNSDTETTLIIALADLKTTALNVIAPAEMLIGTPLPLTVHRVIDNGGPSTPIDATLSLTTSASAGSISPASVNQEQLAMVKDTPVSIDNAASVSCTAPGPQTFTFNVNIAPKFASDVDPDLTNNAKSLTITIDCVVPVAINIRPGFFDNRFSASTADVNVSVLTTLVGEYGLPLAFDATKIVVTSVRFGREDLAWSGGGAALDRRGFGNIKDTIERSDEKTRDGDQDYELRFVRSQTELPTGVVSTGCMKGQFTMGTQTFKFFGCDSIYIQP